MDYQQRLLRSYRRLKWACRITVGATAAFSVWANLLQSEPGPEAHAINAASPVLLFVAFELGSRIPIGKDAHWVYKWLRPLGMVGVAGINAWLSYWHQQASFDEYASYQTAILLPLAIDGTMLIASVSLMYLNDLYRDLDAYVSAGVIKTTATPKDKEKVDQTLQITVPAVKERQPSKKAEVLAYLAKYPTATVAEIASAVKCSPNYVYSIMGAMKAAVPATA